MTRILLGILLFALPLPASAQSSGLASVVGVVKDDAGAVMPGVTVVATRDNGEPEVAVTGIDGAFRHDGLTPGTYRLEATLEGFQPISTPARLTTGQKLEIAFRMVPAFGESVEVVAEATRTGEVAVLESRRESAVVSDSISAEEIRRTPDSSAAGVVERLTGVTLLGDKYVFVRGLGERYSGTTVNGSTLPTTETEKRVVPLDLFPAKLLDTVNVVKTYTPDKAGDFGSGVVELTTTQFPRAETLKVTVGSAYSSGATGESLRRYAGGLDRWGGGGQALPSSIPADFLKRRSILDPNGYSSEELEAFGEALAGQWTGDATTASPASDLALTYGNTFGPLGVVLSGVSNHGYDRVEEELRFFGLDAGDVLVPRNDYEMTTDRETASNGLVGNFSLRLTDKNHLYLSSILTRDASAEDRFQEGLNTNTGGLIRDYRVRYQLEEILSLRLRGDHNFSGPGMGSVAEWSLARSTASNDSDLRENIYRESDAGVFELQTGFAESGKIEFFGLEDEVRQGGIAYTTFFASPGGSWSGSVKGGVDLMERTRDFASRRFRFTTATQPQTDLTLTPEEIFTPANIGANGFEIREITGVNDAYDASHTVDAAYLMSDTTMGRLRVIGGARYEVSDQRVDTFNPFDLTNSISSVNESNDVLPSLNLVYQLAPRTNLRFGYGRSLNRPEFRELSPFTFVEVAGGRSVSGNPELEQATLDGYDLRWETFPGAGQVIAASAFYKMISNPIERIIQPSTELRSSFVNADSAELWGLELELRRPLTTYWSVNLNYAYIQSNVTIGEHQLSVVTNTERPLEGQSDQVGNAALQFHQPRWGTMVRLLANYSGQRLTEVGAFGLPDIYEGAYQSLDVVLSQSLAAFVPGVDLKVAASNLFDAKREFRQGGELQRLFDPGRKVSISLSYTPF